MNKNKGIIGVGLIIVIVLGIVVVGGGAYYLGKSNNEKKEEGVNTPIPSGIRVSGAGGKDAGFCDPRGYSGRCPQDL